MAPPTTRVEGEKIKGPLRNNNGKIVISPERNLGFSDDDSLSIRSMDSSRDEMFDSSPIVRPKTACEPPSRFVSCKFFLEFCCSRSKHVAFGSMHCLNNVMLTPSRKESGKACEMRL